MVMVCVVTFRFILPVRLLPESVAVLPFISTSLTFVSLIVPLMRILASVVLCPLAGARTVSVGATVSTITAPVCMKPFCPPVQAFREISFNPSPVVSVMGILMIPFPLP